MHPVGTRYRAPKEILSLNKCPSCSRNLFVQRQLLFKATTENKEVHLRHVVNMSLFSAGAELEAQLWASYLLFPAMTVYRRQVIGDVSRRKRKRPRSEHAQPASHDSFPVRRRWLMPARRVWIFHGVCAMNNLPPAAESYLSAISHLSALSAMTWTWSTAEVHAAI